jgi:hypothetical protein
MSLMKKFCAVLGALSMASVAFAAVPTTNVAVTGTGAAGALLTEDFMAKAVTTAANTSFSYSLNFSVTGPESLTIDLTQSLTGSKVSFSSFALHDDFGHSFYDRDASALGFDYGSIGAGTYHFIVNGHVAPLTPGLTPPQTVGNSIGLRSFTANIAVSAVPEPEGYALMLAGLGAIGFLSRRRRSV